MADEQVIRREFQAELVPVGDGRTIDMRIIPYGVTARVSDDGRTFYEEEWAPGVFRNKETKPAKTLVNVEHGQGFSDVVGRGVGFNDAADGFYGEFRILPGPDGDKALELINEGAYTGVSLEARAVESVRTAAGVVRRTKAVLRNVALCRNPAFVDAQVLAVRESPDVIAEPDPEPQPEPAPEPEPEPDSERATQVLARIGYEALYFRLVVDRPFDDSRERFTDEEFQRSCLVDGKLPILEPNGDLNVQAMHDAEKRLNRTGMSMSEKAQAARKLMRYYRAARVEAPPSLRTLASK